MITRRELVGAGLTAPALLTFGRAGAVSPDRVFTLGVASGEPAPDGAVIWTRLAPRPLEPGGGMGRARVPVRWEVYADEALRRPVRAGNVATGPDQGHSVHVELRGLPADRPFWFRFVAGGEASPVGRTRSAPAADALPSRLRFCFGSCQKYEVGHYGAWAHAVADDPDLVVFLGDYIYEAAPAPDSMRPHPTPEAVDLETYRLRYASYRLDPLLQAAHAVAPWIVTWDDHEVANDYAGLLDQDGGDPARFRLRRAAAYQAYWEFMPLRRAARPVGASMRLHRTLDWGRLAQFQLLDDRQYRSARPCQLPGPARSLVPDCPDLRDPARTILGREQERWLHAALGRSRARWNILAQQTQMTPYPRRDPSNPAGPADLHTADTWQGHQASRDRILRRWRDARVPNPLVVGGDIHAFVASELRLDDRPVAPCFVGGSITSLAGDKLLKANTAGSDAFRLANNEVRGYARADLTPDRCEVTFRGLADVRDPRTAARDLARFVVAAGDPRLVT